MQKKVKLKKMKKMEKEMKKEILCFANSKVLNERERERLKIKNKIEMAIEKILKYKSIPSLEIGKVMREKLEQKILDLVSENGERKKLKLNEKNYFYYENKKLYLTDLEWMAIEQFKHDLICQVMLSDKTLKHRANVNITDAKKKISIQIDMSIKDTKILLYFKDIIKIDHLVLKELGGVLIKEHNKDLERYSLERKLSNRIITGFENSLTDAFYNKLELSRMKILELLSHEEINKNDNHILVLGAMIKILQIIQALNFEKNQSRLAIIIKDILKERNLTKITIKKYY